MGVANEGKLTMVSEQKRCDRRQSPRHTVCPIRRQGGGLCHFTCGCRAHSEEFPGDDCVSCPSTTRKATYWWDLKLVDRLRRDIDELG